MLSVCPTADYEIYLGRNLLPPEAVLFEPTRKLLGLWQEFGIHGTLFPDVCSAWRHRELGVGDYAERFEAQLRAAAGAGHDVQLHLHPEWGTARCAAGGWSFAPRSGALHDLGFDRRDPAGAPALLRRGIDYLKALLADLVPGYRCIAFRAGAWILQPERDLVRALLDAGLRVDATVIPGVRLGRAEHPVDFSGAPDRTFWFVSPEGGLGVDSGRVEDLLEISIGAYRGGWPFLHHVTNEIRLRRRRARRAAEPPRGLPLVKLAPRRGPLQRLGDRVRKLSIPRPLDVADTCEAMQATLESYLRRYDCVGEEHAICMNGHPKDTYDLHLDEARRFFDLVRTRYATRVRFEPLAACAARLLGPSRPARA